jgi:hypothetical protein
MHLNHPFEFGIQDPLLEGPLVPPEYQSFDVSKGADIFLLGSMLLSVSHDGCNL